MTSAGQTIIGIDVGGTKIHGGLYEQAFSDKRLAISGDTENSLSLKDGEGDFLLQNDKFILLRDAFVLTRAREGIEVVLEQVAGMISDLRREDTVSVGVGLPGRVGHERGLLYRTSNISYTGTVDLGEFFSSRIHLPMGFDNDAKLFTFAEFELHQKERGIQNMLGLTLGTGLGGGIIINGAPYRGTHGFAGELGHAYFDQTQDWEDVIASKGKDEMRGKYLGMFIRGLLNIFDPQVIALGGAISKRFDEFQGEMWEEIKKHKVEEAWKDLLIYPSKIEHPGTLGAAMMGRSILS